MCYGIQERYVMVIYKFHVLKICITMIVYDHSSLSALLKQQRERPKTFRQNVFRPFFLLLRPGLNGDSIEP